MSDERRRPMGYDESWREHAHKIIDDQVRAAVGLEGHAPERHCRRLYPFAERHGWAYKAWCRAMLERFHPERVAGKPIDPRARVAPAELEEHGQERLFQ